LFIFFGSNKNANTAYDIGYIYNFGNFAMTIVYFGKDKKQPMLLSVRNLK